MLRNYYFRLISAVLLISICCSLFGQTLLKLIELTSSYYKYLLILTPLILVFTKFSNKYLHTSAIGMKYFIEKKRVVMSKNNINDDSKEGMSVDEFGAEIANIYGYKSFDDVHLPNPVTSVFYKHKPTLSVSPSHRHFPDIDRALQNKMEQYHLCSR